MALIGTAAQAQFNLTNEATWRANWNLASLEILSLNERVDDGDLNGDTFSGLSGSDAAVFPYTPPGARISSYTYTAGIFGVSFETNAGGTDFGLSMIGENGAFPPNAGEIGSPGILVSPEPTALSLGALGLLGLIFRQRLVARR